MSLERQSRITGPRAIFRVRPHSLACDLLAQSGIRGRGPNRPWKIYGDGCHPKGVALHDQNKKRKKDATQKGWRYTGKAKPGRGRSPLGRGRKYSSPRRWRRRSRRGHLAFGFAEGYVAPSLQGGSLGLGFSEPGSIRNQTYQPENSATLKGWRYTNEAKFRARSRTAECLAATERPLRYGRGDQFWGGEKAKATERFQCLVFE